MTAAASAPPAFTARARPSTRSRAAVVIFATVVAGSVPAIQPILLGGLAAVGRISAAQIGQAATLEAIGMGIAAAACALFACPVRHRWLGPAAALLAVIVNLATMASSGSAIVWMRLFSGLGSGVMPWLFVSLAAKAERPARLSAVYLTFQAATAAAFAAGYTRFVGPLLGVDAAYALLAALNLAVAAGLATLPPLDAEPTRPGISLPTRRGIAGLIAVAFQMAAIFAIWVYAVPIAAGLGIPAETAGELLSIAILLQISSGVLAFSVSRVDERLVLAGSLLVLGCATAAIAAAGFAGFAVSIVLISVIWMFVPSFHLAFLLRLDPSARSAMLLGPFQLAGIALGPSLTGRMLQAVGPSGPVLTGEAMILFALVSGLVALWLRDRPTAA